jgi:16S rRNA (adenine1518-N6/adenine1519-N6)-dimethyltransferase
MFRNIIEAAFQQRRKTLVNALAASKPVNLDKKVIAAGLAELGLDARIRGERLSVEDFVALTNVLRQKSRS